mmetsp:Transcript_4578/g.9934  ORF Transcript_4578/g.9934 Transcript_4578/m.9934 type:complete len:210 (+) Transcript_4578:245-874(+)
MRNLTQLLKHALTITPTVQKRQWQSRVSAEEKCRSDQRQSALVASTTKRVQTEEQALPESAAGAWSGARLVAGAQKHAGSPTGFAGEMCSAAVERGQGPVRLPHLGFMQVKVKLLLPLPAREGMVSLCTGWRGARAHTRRRAPGNDPAVPNYRPFTPPPCCFPGAPQGAGNRAQPSLQGCRTWAARPRCHACRSSWAGLYCSRPAHQTR